MGSIAKLWKVLEDAKQAENEAAQISVNELLYYVGIVVLLGQSSNGITYYRRLNVLG